MITEKPEYTKPPWAPECPWKDHPGYSSQTSERRIGWEAAEAAIYAAMMAPRRAMQVTKYWTDGGPCLVLAGSHEQTREIAEVHFEEHPAQWKEDAMSEEDFTNLPEFEG